MQTIQVMRIIYVCVCLLLVISALQCMYREVKTELDIDKKCMAFDIKKREVIRKFKLIFRINTQFINKEFHSLPNVISINLSS